MLLSTKTLCFTIACHGGSMKQQGPYVLLENGLHMTQFPVPLGILTPGLALTQAKVCIMLPLLQTCPFRLPSLEPSHAVKTALRSH